MEEIWKEIPGFEGLYKISTLGNIKSTNQNKNGKLRKINISTTGYKSITISDKDKSVKSFLVHRLMAITFLLNPENKQFVIHINGDDLDNRIDNIAWATVEERKERNKQITPKVLKRFFNNVEKTESCWIWKGQVGGINYGGFAFNKSTVLAHRFSYELKFGKIPEGLVACHKCDNPKCVNPDHIFIGTQKENMSDCKQKGRYYNTKKTHCKRGHELIESNLFASKRGQRTCKICKLENQKQKRILKKHLNAA